MFTATVYLSHIFLVTENTDTGFALLFRLYRIVWRYNKYILLNYILVSIDNPTEVFWLRVFNSQRRRHCTICMHVYRICTNWFCVPPAPHMSSVLVCIPRTQEWIGNAGSCMMRCRCKGLPEGLIRIFIGIWEAIVKRLDAEKCSCHDVKDVM